MNVDVWCQQRAGLCCMVARRSLHVYAEATCGSCSSGCDFVLEYVHSLGLSYTQGLYDALLRSFYNIRPGFMTPF